MVRTDNMRCILLTNFKCIITIYMWNKVPFAFLALLSGNDIVSLLLRKAVIYLWWCLVWFNPFVFLGFAEPQSIQANTHFFHHLCPHNPTATGLSPQGMCWHSRISLLHLWALCCNFCKVLLCRARSECLAGAVAPHEVGAAFFYVEESVTEI